MPDNLQKIPVRKVVPENASVSHLNHIPENERARFNEHKELPGCVRGEICDPADHFDMIEKCLRCGKML